MKIFKTNLLTFFALSFVLFICACAKNPDIENGSDEMEEVNDSSALLVGRWKVVKDSITNTGDYFFMENGRGYVPNGGVYYGKEIDFWDFGVDGTFSMHENNQSYTFAYKHAGDKLIFPGQVVHDTAKILTLTPTEASFEWAQTSANGGRYFRKSYLKR